MHIRQCRFHRSNFAGRAREKTSAKGLPPEDLERLREERDEGLARGNLWNLSKMLGKEVRVT